MLERPQPRALAALVDAAARVGDASLVPALAALATSTPSIAAAANDAIAGIVDREGLRKGSRALKGVKPEHRAALDRAWPNRRTSNDGA